MSAAHDVPLADLVRPGVARVRPRTENITRLARRTIEADAALYPERPGVDYQRPKTRAECERAGLGSRTPCPFVSCKHHLAIDVSENGHIKHNFPHLDLPEMRATCALAVAADGGATLDGVATLLNVTRERVRQVETKALRLLRAAAEARGITMAECPDESDGRIVGASGRHVSTPNGFPRDAVQTAGRAKR